MGNKNQVKNTENNLKIQNLNIFSFSLGIMTGMSVEKIKFLTYQVYELYSKRLCECLCANYYGHPTRNKKVTRFDSKLAFFRKLF